MVISKINNASATLPVTLDKGIDGRRELNLAALEAWEIYNQEGEAHQLNEAKGWLGVAAGTLDWLIKKVSGDGKKTMLHDQAEKWKLERDLVCAVKGKILRNEAGTIRDALQQIQQTGSAELKEKAAFYLKPEYRAWKGHPLGLLIDYSSDPSNLETTRLLLQRSFELEYGSKAQASALAIYQLVKKYSEDPAVQTTAQGHIDAHEGKSSFSRALERSAFSVNPEELAVDVLIFKGAHRIGLKAASTVASIAGKASISKGTSWLISKGAGFFAEGHALWAGNTAKAAAEQDPEQVFKKEQLGKSYKSNFVMLGLTKFLGTAGNIFGVNLVKRLGMLQGENLTLGGQALLQATSHSAGLGGMIASSQVNEGLGYKDKPKGGINEAIAQDLTNYVAFGIANPTLSNKSTAKGNPSPFNFKRLKEETRWLLLQPAFAFMSMGGLGGGKKGIVSPEQNLEKKTSESIEKNSEDPNSISVDGNSKQVEGNSELETSVATKIAGIIKERKSERLKNDRLEELVLEELRQGTDEKGLVEEILKQSLAPKWKFSLLATIGAKALSPDFPWLISQVVKYPGGLPSNSQVYSALTRISTHPHFSDFSSILDAVLNYPNPYFDSKLEALAVIAKNPRFTNFNRLFEIMDGLSPALGESKLKLLRGIADNPNYSDYQNLLQLADQIFANRPEADYSYQHLLREIGAQADFRDFGALLRRLPLSLPLLGAIASNPNFTDFPDLLARADINYKGEDDLAYVDYRDFLTALAGRDDFVNLDNLIPRMARIQSRRPWHKNFFEVLGRHHKFGDYDSIIARVMETQGDLDAPFAYENVKEIFYNPKFNTFQKLLPIIRRFFQSTGANRNSDWGHREIPFHDHPLFHVSKEANDFAVKILSSTFGPDVKLRHMLPLIFDLFPGERKVLLNQAAPLLTRLARGRKLIAALAEEKGFTDYLPLLKDLIPKPKWHNENQRLQWIVRLLLSEMQRTDPISQKNLYQAQFDALIGISRKPDGTTVLLPLLQGMHHPNTSLTLRETLRSFLQDALAQDPQRDMFIKKYQGWF